jgi:hypothetical protein
MQRLGSLSSIEDTELILVFGASPLRAKLYLSEFLRESTVPSMLVATDETQDLKDQYKAVAVPYAVVVDEDGRIGAKGSVVTFAEIGQLINQSSQLRQQRLSRTGGLETSSTLTDPTPGHRPEGVLA